MKYRIMSLLVLVVLIMNIVYSQCTCEIVDPFPRFFSGEEMWIGGVSRPVYICVEHYYGNYKVIVTYYNPEHEVIRQDEYVNPIMYGYGCFWTTPPLYTESVRVDLSLLSDGDVYVYWDFCVLCCPTTTTVTSTVTSTEIVETTVTETQFIHGSSGWIIVIAVLIIVVYYMVARR